MNQNNINQILENTSLKKEFAIRNLDLDQIYRSISDNLELENKRLHDLLDWVNKYTMCPFRKQMEADGYIYPPIEPDFSNDNDWFLFERWMKGLPVRLLLSEQLSPQFSAKDPNELSEEQLISELEQLEELLYKIHICVDLQKEVPHQLAYKILIDMLNEEFDLLTEGFWHINGCSGYCPGCEQRPWCETGGQLCWSEDEKIGEMYLIDSVRKYVSPSPVSLSILQKLQAQEDKRFNEFTDSNKTDNDKEDLLF
jgi:hypothetical protein